MFSVLPGDANGTGGNDADGNGTGEMVNGEAGVNGAVPKRNNIITITGRSDNCEQAKKALLVSHWFAFQQAE